MTARHAVQVCTVRGQPVRRMDLNVIRELGVDLVSTSHHLMVSGSGVNISSPDGRCYIIIILILTLVCADPTMCSYLILVPWQARFCNHYSLITSRPARPTGEVRGNGSLIRKRCHHHPFVAYLSLSPYLGDIDTWCDPHTQVSAQPPKKGRVFQELFRTIHWTDLHPVCFLRLQIDPNTFSSLFTRSRSLKLEQDAELIRFCDVSCTFTMRMFASITTHDLFRQNSGIWASENLKLVKIELVCMTYERGRVVLGVLQLDDYDARSPYGRSSRKCLSLTISLPWRHSHLVRSPHMCVGITPGVYVTNSLPMLLLHVQLLGDRSHTICLVYSMMFVYTLLSFFKKRFRKKLLYNKLFKCKSRNSEPLGGWLRPNHRRATNIGESLVHWKEDIEIFQMSLRKLKLAQIAHLKELNVLFPTSPRFCKLVKKWLSYGQKRGFARTFLLRSG
eukprot:sb/3464673/